jgi:hypothetical protein
MVWQRLVCANCAGPVAEGRCAVCRRARAGTPLGVPMRVLVLFACLLLALLAAFVVTAARATA